MRAIPRALTGHLARGKEHRLGRIGGVGEGQRATGRTGAWVKGVFGWTHELTTRLVPRNVMQIDYFRDQMTIRPLGSVRPVIKGVFGSRDYFLVPVTSDV